MSIESKDVPKIWRSSWTLLVFVVSIGGGSVAAYAGMDSHLEAKVDKAAENAVAKKWTEAYQAEALKACTTAADQGAYRAISEVMQQTIIPMQNKVADLAKEVEGHRREDDTRVADLNRRVTRLEDRRRIP